MDKMPCYVGGVFNKVVLSSGKVDVLLRLGKHFAACKPSGQQSFSYNRVNINTLFHSQHFQGHRQDFAKGGAAVRCEMPTPLQ